MAAVQPGIERSNTILPPLVQEELVDPEPEAGPVGPAVRSSINHPVYNPSVEALVQELSTGGVVQPQGTLEFRQPAPGPALEVIVPLWILAAAALYLTRRKKCSRP